MLSPLTNRVLNPVAPAILFEANSLRQLNPFEWGATMLENINTRVLPGELNQRLRE